MLSTCREVLEKLRLFGFVDIVLFMTVFLLYMYCIAVTGIEKCFTRLIFEHNEGWKSIF